MLTHDVRITVYPQDESQSKTNEWPSALSHSYSLVPYPFAGYQGYIE